MSLIPIEAAMQHVYADEDDQEQVERKLASAIETAEQFIGRRVYADVDALKAAQVEAVALLEKVVMTKSYAGNDPIHQAINESNDQQKYELVMRIRGIVINPAIEAGILLILGSLYAYRENFVDGSLSELPMAARHHLQPYRVMGV